MNEPLKIRPDFVYVLLCGRKPRTGLPGATFEGVFNEIVADHVPYTKLVHLVVGWQRGVGVFSFSLVVRSEDGHVLVNDGPYEIEMFPQGTQEEYVPITAEIAQYGTYLIEGFLDDELSFRTMLRLVPRAPTLATV